MIKIYPYNLGSESARDLARALHTKCVRQQGTYRPRGSDVIINWGNPRIPGWWNRLARATVVNNPEAVQAAIEKRRTFELFDRAIPPVSHPQVTRDRREAERWLDGSPNTKVLCRTTTRAHGGMGIHVAQRRDQLREAVLYVRYVPKTEEYRIHVVNGQVIDRQQKRRGEAYNQGEGPHRYIRSHANGWIFAREGVQIRAAVDAAAVSAIRALGLNFGAVDIGFHQRHGVQVYEVNTAPGLEGTTITNYVRAFRELYG